MSAVVPYTIRSSVSAAIGHLSVTRGCFRLSSSIGILYSRELYVGGFFCTSLEGLELLSNYRIEGEDRNQKMPSQTAGQKANWGWGLGHLACGNITTRVKMLQFAPASLLKLIGPGR
jgi:hypothetical protein